MEIFKISKYLLLICFLNIKYILIPKEKLFKVFYEISKNVIKNFFDSERNNFLREIATMVPNTNLKNVQFLTYFVIKVNRISVIIEQKKYRNIYYDISCQVISI